MTCAAIFQANERADFQGKSSLRNNPGGDLSNTVMNNANLSFSLIMADLTNCGLNRADMQGHIFGCKACERT
jgi:uncharacterized protein YjbI with pentapeptide repeats